MIALDTHAWIWWNDDPSLLSRNARNAIESADRIGVSVISCFEVARLADEGRITLAMDTRAWISLGLADRRTELIGLSPEAAVTAALLDRRRFPGDPADRLIFASALTASARLATKDRQLRAFDATATIW